jgi:hypothetical protein
MYSSAKTTRRHGGTVAENLAVIRIFKPTGEVLETIKGPKHYKAEGAMLSVTYTCVNGSMNFIKTTLPFIIESETEKPEATVL